ncbi:PilN domain-containing protein [Alysiella crassa]|uniref:Fimbrial assembly protein (PilN) n=1 Tax=Alysiella crassa TaxID=153491 RepID=A0A376BWI2_9NEIS|nr:PilN domain-containing protein [Alysiella crassa]UOP06609.1 PilN domain-containing protein [Alysiella crassa]SSY81153.1 Fimbrial assembly protein (PilN) [Alysiella crassa]
MNLIKINLLPYREMREAKLKKQFQTIMAIGALAGAAVAGLIYVSLNKAIENQETRNSTLQAGIKELESKLATIEELEKRKYNFLERKRKVEELDNKRFEGARVLDSLNQVVPDGSYLITLNGLEGKGNKQGNEYEISGKATADSKIATLMSALPSTGIFDVPDLVEIQKAEDGQRFTLKSVLVQQIVLPKPQPKAVQAAPKSASAPAAK